MKPLISVVVAGAICTMVAACGASDERANYRFRMTVEASVGGQRFTAQAVQAVHAVAIRSMLAEGLKGGAAIHGEAILLDLPDGPIFLLLRERPTRDVPATAVTRALVQGKEWKDSFDFVSSVRKLGRKSGVRAELPARDWPTIIRFENINDPSSAELVDPAKVGISKITVETTDAGISHHLTARLPWLGTYDTAYLWTKEHGGAGTELFLQPAIVDGLLHKDLRFPTDIEPAKNPAGEQNSKEAS